MVNGGPSAEEAGGFSAVSGGIAAAARLPPGPDGGLAAEDADNRGLAAESPAGEGLMTAFRPASRTGCDPPGRPLTADPDSKVTLAIAASEAALGVGEPRTTAGKAKVTREARSEAEMKGVFEARGPSHLSPLSATASGGADPREAPCSSLLPQPAAPTFPKGGAALKR